MHIVIACAGVGVNTLLVTIGLNWLVENVTGSCQVQSDPTLDYILWDMVQSSIRKGDEEVIKSVTIYLSK